MEIRRNLQMRWLPGALLAIAGAATPAVSSTEPITAPGIHHEPVESVRAGVRFEIAADIEDDQGVDLARVYFRAKREAEYVFVPMRPKGARYAAALPAPSADAGAVEYLILVRNQGGALYKTAPFEVKVDKAEAPVAYTERIQVYTELAQAPAEIAGFKDDIVLDVVKAAAKLARSKTTGTASASGTTGGASSTAGATAANTAATGGAVASAGLGTAGTIGLAAVAVGGLAAASGSSGGGPKDESGTTTNRMPAFGEVRYVRTVEENTTGSFGDPVSATDPDGDTLTYSLSGSDAHFFRIDPSTGRLSVAADTMLDDEMRTTYGFKITASDGRLNDEAEVEVRVIRLQGAHGTVRINVTWEADVDLDLYVEDPCDNVLGFGGDRQASCQEADGEWDYDDQGNDGQSRHPGQPHAENIVWTDRAPQGSYSVHVNYYAGSAITSYTVRVFYSGQTHVYTGTTGPGESGECPDRNVEQRCRHVIDFFFGSRPPAGNTTASGAVRSALAAQARQTLDNAIEGVVDGRMRSAPGFSARRGTGADAITALTRVLAGTADLDGCGSMGTKPSMDSLSFPSSGTCAPHQAGTSGWSDLTNSLRNQSFAVTLVDEEEASEDSGLTVWGSGMVGDSGGEAWYWGMDANLSDRWLMGMAWSRERSRVAFKAPGAGVDGQIESDYSMLMPYARMEMGGGLSVWSLAGIGQGSVHDARGELAFEAPSESSGVSPTGALSASVVATGFSHALGELARVRWSVLADAGMVSYELRGGGSGLADESVQVSRSRLGVEGRSGSDGPWTSFVRFGARADGGYDAESGAGIEMTGGLRYAMGRLDAGIEGHWRAAHEMTGETVRGLRTTFDLRSRDNGTGLILSFASGWGTMPIGGELSLLENEDRLYGSPSPDPTLRFDGRVAWGFALPGGGQRRLRPFTEMKFSEGVEQRLRTGLALEVRTLNLETALHWRESTAGESDTGILLRLGRPF